jgi:NADPH:quinone reductase-like Zn-dependent oxidoreductase
MKAAIIESAGAAPVYGDFVEPDVDEGRERVSLVAAGIHPIVRSLAAGTHYGSHDLGPHIPGVDAVARTAGGRLVYTGFVRPPFGTLAERMSVPLGSTALPDGADPVQVAAGMNPGMSSWLPLLARSREVDDLGTVLVLGVTGTAGILAVQNVLALGASRVVGAGRDAARLRLAAARGAQAVRLTGDRTTDAAALHTALDGISPTTVLDFVWGVPAEAAFAALSRRGRTPDEDDTSYLQIGSLAGAEASLPAALLRSARIRIVGSGMGSADLNEIMGQLPVYAGLIADGTVGVPVRTFPLDRVAEAWAVAADAGVRTVVTAD